MMIDPLDIVLAATGILSNGSVYFAEAFALV
jgi:hypothetical protein